MSGVRGRRSIHGCRHEQAGVSMLEVLVVVALIGLTMAPLAGWVFVTARSQADSRARNDDTAGLGLTSTYFSRDVENSMAAASSTTVTGTVRPTSDLKDCIGGDGAGGQVRLVLVTAANRRIVYSVGASVKSSAKGSTLWRRECPNLSSATDATLNDPTLSAPPALSPGHIDPSVPGNNGSALALASGIDSVATSCPLKTGTGQDPVCRSIRLSAVRTSGSTVVLQATRRVTAYAPPGTAPHATFRYSMTSATDSLPPERNKSVTFDASASIEYRGEALTYSWDFGDGSTATGAVVTHTYAKSTATGTAPDGSLLAPYGVVLTVSSVNGTDAMTQQITVVPIRPTATVTTPVPIAAVQFSPLSLSGALTSSDDVNTLNVTTPNPIVSAFWDWGDGTAPTPAGCAAGARSCSSTIAHTYTTTGQKVVTLAVTDTLGQTATRLVTVTVRSGYFYVSTSGTDTGACGPQSNPCASIATAITNALANNRSGIRVAKGTYARFNVANGISVTGGYSSDFTSQGAPGDTTTVTPASGAGGFTGMSASSITSPTTVSSITVVAGTPADGSSPAGIVVSGSTSALVLDRMVVTGGTGPHATGILVSGASTVTVQSSTIASGTATGNGTSAYGIRAIGSSTVNLIASTVTASKGSDGSNAGTVPPKAANGCTGPNGGNAGGASAPGGGGTGCGPGFQKGGDGGTGGNYSGAGSGGGKGGGDGANGGNGGCGSYFGCGTNAGGGSGGNGKAGGAAGGGGTLTLTGIAVSAADVFVPPTGGTGGPGSVGHGGGGGGGGKSASASGGGGGAPRAPRTDGARRTARTCCAR